MLSYSDMPTENVDLTNMFYDADMDDKMPTYTPSERLEIHTNINKGSDDLYYFVDNNTGKVFNNEKPILNVDYLGKDISLVVVKNAEIDNISEYFTEDNSEYTSYLIYGNINAKDRTGQQPINPVTCDIKIVNYLPTFNCVFTDLSSNIISDIEISGVGDGFKISLSQINDYELGDNFIENINIADVYKYVKLILTNPNAQMEKPDEEKRGSMGDLEIQGMTLTVSYASNKLELEYVCHDFYDAYSLGSQLIGIGVLDEIGAIEQEYNDNPIDNKNMTVSNNYMSLNFGETLTVTEVGYEENGGVVGNSITTFYGDNKPYSVVSNTKMQEIRLGYRVNQAFAGIHCFGYYITNWNCSLTFGRAGMNVHDIYSVIRSENIGYPEYVKWVMFQGSSENTLDVFKNFETIEGNPNGGKDYSFRYLPFYFQKEAESGFGIIPLTGTFTLNLCFGIGVNFSEGIKIVSIDVTIIEPPEE